jgi:hypothetical protein
LSYSKANKISPCVSSLLLVSCSTEGDLTGEANVQPSNVEVEAELLGKLENLFDLIATESDAYQATLELGKEGAEQNINPALLEEVQQNIIALSNMGVSEQRIAFSMQNGSSRRLLVEYTDKATPCHDAHEGRMSQISAVAAVCLVGTVITGNALGAALCLVGYEAGRLASESTFRKCINR